MKQNFSQIVMGILSITIGSAMAEDNSGFLAANGTSIRDNHGQGKVIQLKGVNIGGWLEWQEWMCPMDSSGTLKDINPGHNGYDYEVRHLLEKRFGSKVAGELLDCYEDSWFNTTDLDNIKGLGMNVVRLTVAYDTIMNEDGTWRADGFKKMDWLVENAWKRGIYTIIDFHAFLPPTINQDGSSTGYWKQPQLKDETVRIWEHIAEHYRGNPSVAMYDVLNEPINSAPSGLTEPDSETVCAQYSNIYAGIRSVDPEHMVCVEGLWDWHSLQNPEKAGYKNVVYSFHFYHFGAKSLSENNAQTVDDLSDVSAMQTQWKIPVFVGEFNFFGDFQAWDFGINAFDKAGLCWTVWSYKNKSECDCSWGVYDLAHGKQPAVPDLTKDSADQIRQKWAGWATQNDTFVLNPLLAQIFKSGTAH